ncbi:uncharacterized vacuolar protein, putative [Candida dubliniensis CD36]|uniref:Uncharacterized vacuolar protein, putative n=1 Tax=Candida dubliniensis (strain CD36 / ATCC MYA-646 / CBS 7987 / NCPF 3949 / NRRL Y-17841) TaxID=573826 RepID=B9WJU9_CANDC|nr:uncharacterized vacuolar protein, putative [Candida dubliniensis CD36]CAX40907.1 uncharacterized vacuolar protein, putative [Candida dubliniensis CD36]
MDSDPANILLLLVFASIVLFFALSFCAYRLFCRNSDRNEYSSLDSDILGSHSNNVPREFLNDEESLLDLAETFDFTNLSPEEQGSYLKGQEFTTNNPPDFTKVRGKTFTIEDEKLIKECGINAFQFDPDQELLNSRYIVADKTELNFNNNDMPYSTATTVLNYPLPVRNRIYSDIVYFETKVFEFTNENNPNAHFSIGLVTKPYPSAFRLPGYNKFSIGYESTGNLKINKPFPTPLQQHQDEHSEYNALVLPPLQQSDIVGFGYVISTGTIFITRNGKKVLDVMKGCFVDLYPAVGCFSTNAKFQVNLGQLGFVWIEANVRKYGFVSTSDYKKISGDRGLASLPQYDKVIVEGDKVLDKGEELPPRYPEEELDFFGRTVNDNVRVGSSSQHMKLSEKNEDGDAEVGNEVKEPVEGSSSQVTDEPEEIMDLRERIYEQNIQNETSSIDESTPLIAQNEISVLDGIVESPLEDNKNEESQSESQQLEPVEENEETNENIVEEEPLVATKVSANDSVTTQEEALIENTESSVTNTENLKPSEPSSSIPEEEQEPTSQPVSVPEQEPAPQQEQQTEPVQEPAQEEEPVPESVQDSVPEPVPEQKQETVTESVPASTQTEEGEDEVSEEHGSNEGTSTEPSASPEPTGNDENNNIGNDSTPLTTGSSSNKPNQKKKKKKNGKKGGKKKGKKK